ncbi:unnamed protein product, partial [Prorocentrum cordatum]
GDGTAALCADDSRIFTLSMHCGDNFPLVSGDLRTLAMTEVIWTLHFLPAVVTRPSVVSCKTICHLFWSASDLILCFIRLVWTYTRVILWDNFRPPTRASSAEIASF